MNQSERTARNSLKGLSLEKLCDLWELTETQNTPEAPIVRGWLMDEIEARNPAGFDRWLSQDAPDDKDLRHYVLEEV